jgi:hypothetical protein
MLFGTLYHMSGELGQECLLFTKHSSDEPMDTKPT